MKRRKWTGAVVAAALLLALAALPAAANGTPIIVKLASLPGVTNFADAIGATGEARLVLVEGDVKVTVNGLPRLANDRYEVFIVNSATRARVSAGKFNSPDRGTASLQSVVDKLEAGRFDMVLITVEPEPDPSPDPDSRVALAGRFQVPPPSGQVEAVGTPTGPTIPSATGEIPITLPRTGWPASPAIELLFGAAVVLAGAGLIAVRRR